MMTKFQFDKYKLPSALQVWDQLEQLMIGKQVIILLDYDGTLVPICSEPSLGKIAADKKYQLKKLSQHYLTAITSGRPLKEQVDFVNAASICHIGHYGYEIKLPYGPSCILQRVEKFLSEINRAYLQLANELSGIEGILIENKKYSLSIHFQLVDGKLIRDIEHAVDKITSDSSFLRKFYSKKIFEVRPNISWDKGDTILYLFQVLNLDKNNILPIYIGDDITDESAFEAIHGHGVGILVSKYDRPTLASYRLRDVDEVWEYLDKMIKRSAVPYKPVTNHIASFNKLSEYRVVMPT